MKLLFKRDVPLRYPMVLILFISSISTLSAGGERDDEILQPTAPLLVLLAASDESSMAVERQLVGELRLTLDSLEVEQVVIEREDFLELTLPTQLAVVQPLIRRFMARAVVWVTIGTGGGYIIQFVVTDRGNATVRTVEAGSPEELALAVRELLDTSYLFAPKQKKRANNEQNSFFSIGMLLGLNGGMYGHHGASLSGGMGISGRFDVLDGLFFGPIFGGKCGPGQTEFDGLISGWRIDTGLFVGYLFRFGKFGIGPRGELTALRSAVNAVLGQGDYLRYSWWSFRGALGIEVLLKLNDKFSIFIDWTIGGISKSHVFKRESTGAEVIATPIIDYAFTIGFVTGIL